jgi:hypothetical protein
LILSIKAGRSAELNLDVARLVIIVAPLKASLCCVDPYGIHY